MTLLEVFVGIFAAVETYNAVRIHLRDAKCMRESKRHLEIAELNLNLSNQNVRANEKAAQYSQVAFDKARLSIYADAYTRGMDDAKKVAVDAAKVKDGR